MSHTPHGKDEGPKEGARTQRGEVTKSARKKETSSRPKGAPLVCSVHPHFMLRFSASSATEMAQVLLPAAAETDAGALGRDDYVQKMLKHFSGLFWVHLSNILFSSFFLMLFILTRVQAIGTTPPGGHGGAPGLNGWCNLCSVSQDHLCVFSQLGISIIPPDRMHKSKQLSPEEQQ